MHTPDLQYSQTSPLGLGWKDIGFNSQPTISHHQFTLHAVGYCSFDKYMLERGYAQHLWTIVQHFTCGFYKDFT